MTMTAHSPQTVTTIPQMNSKVQLVSSAFGVDQQWQSNNNLIGPEPDRWQPNNSSQQAQLIIGENLITGKSTHMLAEDLSIRVTLVLVSPVTH